MKLAVLGGGGFRVPYVYQALLRDTGSPRVDDLWLYDRDATRLRAMTGVLDQLTGDTAAPPKVTATTSLDDAVRGADFVFTAIRVGGLAGRVADERVALDLGVLGQETTGPGGIAFGLRTIPVMTGIAHRIRALAPDAFTMNFTNPAGMITEAMRSVLGDRVVGICDTPSGLGRRVATLLDVAPDEVELDYVGLNHLGWLRGIRHGGTDLLPRVLADDALLGELEEGRIFGADWLRTLGVIPNEYLFYYDFNREAVRAIVESGQTRGEFLTEQQGGFFDALLRDPEHGAALWRETVMERSARYMAEARGGEEHHVEEPDPANRGYAGVALAVMAAVARGERGSMILNVGNGGTVAGLPADAVVEVPVTVDADGAHPHPVPPPELWQLGLMQRVKAVERATIEAATTGSRSVALRAFALHPLVGSVPVARRLLSGYLAAIPEVAAALPA